MSGTLIAAVSSDIDTLESIYKGQGCRRAGGYSYAEFQSGLETFARFLEPYGVQATLFMVGNDFRIPTNHGAIRAMHAAGHEIANHSCSHPQGFRWLTPAEKEAEIAGMEDLCQQVTGQRPVGFRSPGWNISDDALPILQRRGYLYDSSVFPTSIAPLLKLLHWYTMRGRTKAERTTLGYWRYALAPPLPYRTSQHSLAHPGHRGLLEFPVTVAPVLRLPFFATFLLATGFELFKMTYRALLAWGYPVQFQFHLSDFVEYNQPELAEQVPRRGDGVYVPQALWTPLDTKLRLFRQALDTIAQDYTFCTLEQWAHRMQDGADA